MLEPTDSHQIEHAIVSGILSSRDRHLERVGFGPGSIDEIQPLQIFYQNDWNPNKSLDESIPKEKKDIILSKNLQTRARDADEVANEAILIACFP